MNSTIPDDFANHYWGLMRDNLTDAQIKIGVTFLVHEIFYWLIYLPYFVAERIPALNKYKLQQARASSDPRFSIYLRPSLSPTSHFLCNMLHKFSINILLPLIFLSCRSDLQPSDFSLEFQSVPIFSADLPSPYLLSPKKNLMSNFSRSHLLQSSSGFASSESSSPTSLSRSRSWLWDTTSSASWAWAWVFRSLLGTTFNSRLVHMLNFYRPILFPILH